MTQCVDLYGCVTKYWTFCSRLVQSFEHGISACQSNATQDACWADVCDSCSGVFSGRKGLGEVPNGYTKNVFRFNRVAILNAVVHILCLCLIRAD